MSSTLSQQLTQSHKHHNHSITILQLPPVTALAKTTLSSTINTNSNQNNINYDETPRKTISKKHKTSHWKFINCALIYAIVLSHGAVMLNAFETEYTSMQSTIDRALATTVRTPAQMTETDGGKY